MRTLRALFVCGLLAGIGVAVTLPSCGSSSESAEPHVAGKSREAIGRYIILTAGCNDCHTPGWKEGMNVPESQWLTGIPEGWRGPWGTTYASNLRLTVQLYTEEVFVKGIKARNTKPPMPWRSLHAMTDNDLASIYAFIKSLGPTGKPMPVDLPPGQDPTTPYVSFIPIQPHPATTQPR